MEPPSSATLPGAPWRDAGPDGTPLWNLPDTRIAGKDESACPHRRRLEIRVVGGKELPLRRLFPENPDRSHLRKFLPQALVMRQRRRQPDAIVRGRFPLLAQDQQ